MKVGRYQSLGRYVWSGEAQTVSPGQSWGSLGEGVDTGLFRRAVEVPPEMEGYAVELQIVTGGEAQLLIDDEPFQGNDPHHFRVLLTAKARGGERYNVSVESWIRVAMNDQSDDRWMAEALRLAEAALDHDEVPVGCVIVHQGRAVGRAHNQRETLQDPTAHAEMIAVTQAAEALGSWRLTGCTLYVTLEPCVMCAGAMVLARLDRLVYGAADPKAGAVESIFRILDEKRLNHRVEETGGVLAEPCGRILSEFFRAKRGTDEVGGEADD